MNYYLYRLRYKGKKNNLYRRRFIYFFWKKSKLIIFPL